MVAAAQLALFTHRSDVSRRMENCSGRAHDTAAPLAGRSAGDRDDLPGLGDDARGSTGTLYWEGAVRAFDERGQAIGRGYLELTGYGERLRF